MPLARLLKPCFWPSNQLFPADLRCWWHRCRCSLRHPFAFHREAPQSAAPPLRHHLAGPFTRVLEGVATGVALVLGLRDLALNFQQLLVCDRCCRYVRPFGIACHGYVFWRMLIAFVSVIGRAHTHQTDVAHCDNTANRQY